MDLASSKQAGTFRNEAGLTQAVRSSLKHFLENTWTTGGTPLGPDRLMPAAILRAPFSQSYWTIYERAVFMRLPINSPQ